MGEYIDGCFIIDATEFLDLLSRDQKNKRDDMDINNSYRRDSERNNIAPITKGEIADILVEIILPYYKGVKLEQDGLPHPQFRRSLTGEETQNLFTSLHHLITVIMSEDEHNGPSQNDAMSA